MSFRKLNLFAFAAAMLLAVVSCKEDETESLPYLNGSLYFECPSFVSPGQKVILSPDGVEHPEDGEIGYYWKVTPTMTKSDTVTVFEFQFPDTLQAYNVSCYAFAEGYNGSSFSMSVDVMKNGLDGSLRDTGISVSDKKITVDGIDYYYETIAGLDWFRNNLASESCGIPYQNEAITSDIFGRFYSYNEAVTACPEGWRLPSEDDWMALADELGVAVTEKYSTFEDVTAKLLVSATVNGNNVLEYWPVVGDVNNESKLGFIPFGFVNLGNKAADGRYPLAAFEGIYEYLAVWTADTVEGEESMAYYRYLRSDLPDMLVGKGDADSFGANVRCVRDAE